MPVNGKTKPDLIIFDPPYFSKKDTRLVMLNTDWRDFKGTPAMEETHRSSILITDYCGLPEKTGWGISYLIHAPMSLERFQGDVAAEMEKKKILGVTGRYVIVAGKTVFRLIRFSLKPNVYEFQRQRVLGGTLPGIRIFSPQA